LNKNFFILINKKTPFIMLAYFNNKFIEAEKAVLPISDLSIQRGYGVFDFFRTVNYHPLFIDDHLDRFFNSAAGLYLVPPHSKEEIKAIIFQLINKNRLPDCGIKLLLTGGCSTDSYTVNNSSNFFITQQQIPPFRQEIFDAGVKVITQEHQRELPYIKSINYLMGVWLQQKVKEHQAFDVLYNKQGIVSELPRANVFIVTYDNKIVTPSTNILHGITRKKVLKLAATNYKVEEREVNMMDIKNAAEVFMTSTTKRILPINQVDEMIIGEGKAGPITTLLYYSFLQMEEQASL
jgi:D-alanine transaminase/branched-chain amino acid aminotransferase